MIVEIIAGILVGAGVLASIVATSRTLYKEASGRGCSCSRTPKSCAYGSDCSDCSIAADAGCSAR
ncbi:MAG: hypothetical protein ACYS8W_01665 [Planctomycetota bacterium]